jgi:hypothetical protein
VPPRLNLFKRLVAADEVAELLARKAVWFDRAVEELQKEIARLRSLVSRAANELRDAGSEDRSRRLLRALDGR